jgi:hypothetical protein
VTLTALLLARGELAQFSPVLGTKCAKLLQLRFKKSDMLIPTRDAASRDVAERLSSCRARRRVDR